MINQYTIVNMKKISVYLFVLCGIFAKGFSQEYNESIKELDNFLTIGQPSKRMLFSNEEDENFWDVEEEDFFDAKETMRNAKRYYDAGDNDFDAKKFESACENYRKAVTILTIRYYVVREDINGNYKGEGKPRELLYYSLYNMACCKSKLKQFSEARQYLYYAVLAGYPYFNYILKDEDMKPFFEAFPETKKELNYWKQAGNELSTVAGKEFHRAVFNGGTEITLYKDGTFRDECKDMYGWGGEYGTYSINNYVLTLNYTTRYWHLHSDFDWHKAYENGEKFELDDLFEKEEKREAYKETYKISIWHIEYPYHDNDNSVMRWAPQK